MPDDGPKIPVPPRRDTPAAPSVLDRDPFWSQPPQAGAADPTLGHSLSDFSVHPAGGPGGGLLGDFAGPLSAAGLMMASLGLPGAGMMPPTAPPTQTQGPTPTSQGPTPTTQTVTADANRTPAGQEAYHQVTAQQLHKIMWGSAGIRNAPTAPEGAGAAHDRLEAKYEHDEKAYEKDKKAYDKKYGKRIAAFDHRIEENVEPMNAAMEKHHISDVRQQAAFLGNIAVESSGMTAMVEKKSGQAVSQGAGKGVGMLMVSNDAKKDLSDKLHLGEKKHGHYDGLTAHPEMASDPQHAAEIAASYWTDPKWGNANAEMGQNARPHESDVRRASAAVQRGAHAKLERPQQYGARLTAYDRGLETFQDDLPAERKAQIAQERAQIAQIAPDQRDLDQDISDQQHIINSKKSSPAAKQAAKAEKKALALEDQQEFMPQHQQDIGQELQTLPAAQTDRREALIQELGSVEEKMEDMGLDSMPPVAPARPPLP